MYFDFDEYRPDISPVGRAISWREGILLSIIVHLMMILLVVLSPKLFPFDAEAARARVAAIEEQQREAEAPRFVFVQPRVDTKALRPPPRAEASDQDREARAPERAPKPENSLPFSRGDSYNRVERSNDQAQRGEGPSPEPAPQADAQAGTPEQPKLPEAQSSMQLPSNRPANQPQGTIARVNPPGGALGDALRNLGRYIEQEQFNNPKGGGGSPDPNIQFDTKGVEFGPWLRRFVAQVRRNWEPLIPYAAMSLRGHVVVTFNIHKDGSISDLTVVAPCPVEGFNNAAYGAMAASNPTYSLPPEYPSDRAFFTVTFFYNEQPPR